MPQLKIDLPTGNAYVIDEQGEQMFLNELKEEDLIEYAKIIVNYSEMFGYKEGHQLRGVKAQVVAVDELQGLTEQDLVTETKSPDEFWTPTCKYGGPMRTFIPETRYGGPIWDVPTFQKQEFKYDSIK